MTTKRSINIPWPTISEMDLVSIGDGNINMTKREEANWQRRVKAAIESDDYQAAVCRQ